MHGLARAEAVCQLVIKSRDHAEYSPRPSNVAVARCMIYDAYIGIRDWPDQNGGSDIKVAVGTPRWDSVEQRVRKTASKDWRA